MLQARKKSFFLSKVYAKICEQNETHCFYYHSFCFGFNPQISSITTNHKTQGRGKHTVMTGGVLLHMEHVIPITKHIQLHFL